MKQNKTNQKALNPAFLVKPGGREKLQMAKNAQELKEQLREERGHREEIMGQGGKQA